MEITERTFDLIQSGKKKKPNVIWLECTGCSGNIISLLNATNPDANYFLKSMINLRFSNSLMFKEGEKAFEVFLETIKEDFILLVDGAISTKNDGNLTIISTYKGEKITAAKAVKIASDRTDKIIAVGTCASYGGISAAKPNPSGSVSLSDFLKKKVLKLPGCPIKPNWLIGTIASLILYDYIPIDEDGRPLMFYNDTIHDHCPRRSYFSKGIFAKNIGDKECMFKLGCRGPITKADCPIYNWNNRMNWPIGANTPCIGCAQKYFPDGMEPFINA